MTRLHVVLLLFLGTDKYPSFLNKSYPLNTPQPSLLFSMSRLPLLLVILLLSFPVVLVSCGFSEDLAAAARPIPIHEQGFGRGLKSAWLNIRAKVLRTKVSDRWLQCFTSSPDCSGRVLIPEEDAIVPASPLRIVGDGRGKKGPGSSWSRSKKLTGADRVDEARARLDQMLNRPTESSPHWWSQRLHHSEIEEVGSDIDRSRMW